MASFWKRGPKIVFLKKSQDEITLIIQVCLESSRCAYKGMAKERSCGLIAIARKCLEAWKRERKVGGPTDTLILDFRHP